jgi:peptide deformylase
VDDPILREELPEFNFADPPVDPIEFAHELAEHMMYYNGIGLAANQLGLPYRCFAMRADPIVVCYNPVITDETTKTILYEEGCLTFPHLFMKIKRPESIKARFYEPNGNVRNVTLTGMSARVFLHEYDHLEGVLFIDRVSDLKLQMAMKRAKKHQPRYDFDTEVKQEVKDKFFNYIQS